MMVRRLSVTVGLASLSVAVLAAAGGATTSSRSAACPDPNTAPLGKSVGVRGYSACNDGAFASVIVGGEAYRFRGGVCWKDSQLPLNVDIGTIVHDRVKSDPPGFGIVVAAKGSPISDSVSFGLNKGGKLLEFAGPVTLKYKAGRLGATIKGKVLKTVNEKVLTGTVPVSGSFTCKQILKVPT